MAQDPGYYAAWYIWRKPFLLWDWDIKIGYGGPYVLAVANSPLQTNGLLSATTNALATANPILTIIAMIGGLLLLLDLPRLPARGPAAMCVAGLFVYLIGIHTVFQAEPRYANAYRWLELLMMASALQAMGRFTSKVT
jgi:hypothetical protein